MPSAHQSTAGPYPSPLYSRQLTTSGARYSGVPQKVRERCPVTTRRARPKSIRQRLPCRPTITFSGLRSRHMKPASWSWRKPRVTWKRWAMLRGEDGEMRMEG
eukprot:3230638-Prymnesium_polylepis.2